MKMSRLEAGTRVVLDYFAAFNRQDISQMMACLNDDCTLEAAAPAPQGAVYHGKQAIAQYWQDFFALKKEPHLEIEEIFGLGNRCVVCWRLQWLDKQGQPKTLRGAEVFKIREGLICEQFSYTKSCIDF
ncbi:MAG: nuclear transport factor 2 family protein [Anaerolineales bacterium]|nr:nuclear transport factor 2 family protein [Anaerolineales bacterium]